MIVVGCKNDFVEERTIEYEDGERVADGFQAPYIECSSKNNETVDDVFELVIVQCFKHEKHKRDANIRTQIRHQAIQNKCKDRNQK